jgi:DNA topoisomerase-1
MEEDLDKVAEGKLVWNKVLADFYTLFEPRVKNAFNDMDKKAPETTGEVCPECGSPLVKRKGRYGEFVACSNYPTCKYIKKEPKVVKEIMPCPECGEGMVIEKHTKRGKIFYGCNRYPKCKFASWDEPLQRTCPKCGKYLVKHNKEIKCSNCDYIES